MLHLGYFERFKSRDAVVLFEGDADALEKLARVLRSLAWRSLDHIALETLPFVQAHRGLTVFAERVAKSQGLVCADWKNRSSVPGDGTTRPAPRFTWRLTSDDWAGVVELLTPVADGGGHQYLTDFTGTNDDATVMVSDGERGEAFWRRFG